MAGGCTERIVTSGWRNGPIAVADDAMTPPGFLVVIPVLDNDWDPEGEALTVVEVTAAEHGEVNHDGTNVSYTPNLDFVGEEVLVYKVEDTDGYWAFARIKIGVFLPPNRLPVAVDDQYATTEQTSLSLDVLANDSDPDPWDTLSIASVGVPLTGTATVDGGSISYTARDEWEGTDSFSYTISDGRDGTATATVTVVVDTVDDPPTATQPAQVTTSEGVPIDITLTGTDPEDPEWLLVIDITTPPLGGSVNFTSGLAPFVVRYTPAPGFSGTDSFGFTVTDTGENVSPEVVVTIVVTGTNDDPVANDDTASVEAGSQVVIDVLANDLDPDLDPLTVTGAGTPANGSTSFSTSDVTYTPTGGFVGQDSFTYDISDGNGGTATGTVTVTVFEDQVPPLYAGAPDWNDYVENDGTGLFDASGTTCAGTGAGGYDACLHGGELRAIPVPGRSTCGLLTATDTLGAFDWVCDDSTDPVRMVSVGLRAGKSLRHLLETGAVPAFRANSVRVVDGGPILFETPPAVWWSNPVVPLTSGTLDQAGAIYVVAADTSLEVTIAADRVGLVVLPGAHLSGPGGTSLVSSSATVHLWVEGDFDGAGYTDALTLTNVVASRLTEATFEGADVQARLVQSNGNLLHAVDTVGGSVGVQIEATSADNRLESVAAAKSTVAGIEIAGTGTVVVDSIAAACGVGYSVSGVGVVLEHANATNNSSHGVVLSGDDAIVVGSVSGSNGGHGLWVTGADVLVFGATAGLNGGSGFRFEGAGSFATHLAAENNGGGGVHALTGVNQTYADLSISDNAVFGFGPEAPAPHLTGVITLGYNGGTDLQNEGNCPDLGQASPGISWNGTACAPAGASDFVLHSSYLFNALVGRILLGDTENPTDATGIATYHPDLDWVTFENRFRGWGVDGSSLRDEAARGDCSAGTCHIWDWSASSTTHASLTQVPCPNGDSVISHTWSDASSASILRGARELVGDGVGDDDWLCESNEACLYLALRNAWQGEGVPVAYGCFIDGATFTGVQLFSY